ncbi:phage head morphogenesis protein, SPP1 gp7 family [compost metagenome]
MLEAQGWWGKQVIVDSEGGAEVVQLGSPRRLRTIYQTNLQSAYMAGRKAEQEAAAETHPFWQYVAILDGRTRPSHRALSGQVYRWDDPIWSAIYPPNGFNCRCRVTTFSARAVQRRGLAVVSSAGQVSTETVEVGVNKRTGEIRHGQITVVRTRDAAGKPIMFSTDPGFNHAPGAGAAEALKRKTAQ